MALSARSAPSGRMRRTRVTSASHLSWAGTLLLGLFVLPMAAHPAGAQELHIVNPLPDAQVGAGYGWRVHPRFGRNMPHEGIDLVASRGTPVLAAAAGTVQTVSPQIGYGNLVVIDHGAGYKTRYAHLDSIAVEPGQLVRPGQPIGTVGSTGWATYDHLHFEVLLQGDAMSPHPFVAEW